jgi:hypothetical protein
MAYSNNSLFNLSFPFPSDAVVVAGSSQADLGESDGGPLYNPVKSTTTQLDQSLGQNFVDGALYRNSDGSKLNVDGTSSIQNRALVYAKNLRTYTEAALKGVQSAMGEELDKIATADSALRTSINTNASAISTEVTARENADTTLHNNIAAEEARALAAEAANASAISTEATARENADTTLQTDLADEATTRASADTNLQTAIDNEVSARASADTTLQNNIDNEATTRANQDTSLQNSITALSTRLDNLALIVADLVDSM